MSSIIAIPRFSGTRFTARPAPFKLDSFRYADQLGLALPALILGIRVSPVEFEKPDQQRAYRFKEGRKWVKLAHQAGGRQFRYHATVLTPKLPVTNPMVSLLADTVHAAPDGYPRLTSVALYAARLAVTFGGGVSCDTCYHDLAAGHYPLDMESLPLLAEDLPPNGNPDEFLHWDSGYQRAMGSTNRWSLVILGANRPSTL